LTNDQHAGMHPEEQADFEARLKEQEQEQEQDDIAAKAPSTEKKPTKKGVKKKPAGEQTAPTV
jgi:hypothetical protein